MVSKTYKEVVKDNPQLLNEGRKLLDEPSMPNFMKKYPDVINKIIEYREECFREYEKDIFPKLGIYDERCLHDAITIYMCKTKDDIDELGLLVIKLMDRYLNEV